MPKVCTPTVIVRGAFQDFEVPERPRRRFQQFASGISRVDQSALEEADINNVIRRYRGTGELPLRRDGRQAVYTDVSEVEDLQTSLNRVRSALNALEAVQAARKQNAEASSEAPAPAAPPVTPASPPETAERSV